MKKIMRWVIYLIGVTFLLFIFVLVKKEIEVNKYFENKYLSKCNHFDEYNKNTFMLYLIFEIKYHTKDSYRAYNYELINSCLEKPCGIKGGISNYLFDIYFIEKYKIECK
jgi:hypothetical protein